MTFEEPQLQQQSARHIKYHVILRHGCSDKDSLLDHMTMVSCMFLLPSEDLVKCNVRVPQSHHRTENIYVVKGCRLVEEFVQLIFSALVGFLQVRPQALDVICESKRDDS